MFNKHDQNVTNYLGYFCNKNCCQELSKIAQSGRTADDDDGWNRKRRAERLSQFEQDHSLENGRTDGERDQCDQMVEFFFFIWPFATMKISPIV